MAKTDSEINMNIPFHEYITEVNILLSGVGFESSRLKSAHSVHDVLTALNETPAYNHVEQVAFVVFTGHLLQSLHPMEYPATILFAKVYISPYHLQLLVYLIQNKFVF